MGSPSIGGHGFADNVTVSLREERDCRGLYALLVNFRLRRRAGV